MPTKDLFTRREVLRIAGITPQQLTRWESLELVTPREQRQEKIYTFADLIALRAIKALTAQGVQAQRLREAVDALRHELSQVEAPLVELRIVSNGRNVAVEYEGHKIEPISGQRLFDFKTAELRETLQAMPARTPEEWFAVALDCEANPERRAEAIQAYQRVIEAAPHWAEAYINMGTLYYEQGQVALAIERYQAALHIAPENALAHFNLGSVLDELKQWEEAREHLREAVKADPNYADAHYNLARVYEQLGEPAEALPHWRRYLELDPDGPAAEDVRRHLTEIPDQAPGASAGDRPMPKSP